MAEISSVRFDFEKQEGGEDVKWDLGKVEIEERHGEKCESLDLTQMSFI